MSKYKKNNTHNVELVELGDLEPELGDGTTIEIMFFDYDGPLNNGGKRSDLAGKGLTWKQISERGFLFPEQEPNSAALAFYSDNLDYLKATLSILARNNIVCIPASQRNTFGHAITKLLGWINQINIQDGHFILSEAVLKDIKKYPLLSIDTEFEEKNTFIKPFKALIKDILSGKKVRATPDAKDILATGKMELETKSKTEDGRRAAMLSAYDAAFGKDRPFLREDLAIKIGKIIAYSGETEATGKDKWGYAKALKQIPEFSRITSNNITLIDDADRYQAGFEKQNAHFIHAPREEDATFHEDNLYLGEALLKIPKANLTKELNQIPDPQIALQLKILVFLATMKSHRDLVKDFTTTAANAKNANDLVKSLKTTVEKFVSNSANLDDIAVILNELSDKRYNFLRQKSTMHWMPLYKSKEASWDKILKIAINKVRDAEAHNENQTAREEILRVRGKHNIAADFSRVKLDKIVNLP